MLNSTTTIHPPNTWWPDLYFDLKPVVNVPWKRGYLRNHAFWACPGAPRHNWKICGGIQDSYCKSWDCVTSNDGSEAPGYRRWDVGNRDLLNFSFAGPIPLYSDWEKDHNFAQVKIRFNIDKAKKEKAWVNGISWGLQTRNDLTTYNGIIVVSQVLEPVHMYSIGPNPVEPVHVTPYPTTSLPTLQRPTKDPEAGPLVKLGHTDPLWKLVKAAYATLNQTHPKATKSCWLCYNLIPPYYEAVGLNASYDLANGTDPPQCRWGDRKVGLTMREVWGRGLCMGKILSGRSPLCAHVVEPTDLPVARWLIPRMGGWWVCSHTGLTPCLHSSIFDPKEEFCVMVAVVPKILYRPEETIYDYWAQRLTLSRQERTYRVKREPITAITIATMFGLGIAGARTGITALSLQSQGFNSLRAAIDEDITCIEQSISHLESSLTSLSEVVLQNRRGLDLLFLQQGGLCAALGEECCFYADHTGIVRESMAKVREGLAQRKREREAQQGWFKSWFQQSPWLTTLISTLLGPLLVLLLMLAFGSCVINRLVAFVKERINTVQLLVLWQQYQTVSQNQEEDSSI
ncbi:hypothetical protein AB1E18_013943 [Capra hircus]